jgi:acyl-homoserine-lactone acylase
MGTPVLDCRPGPGRQTHEKDSTMMRSRPIRLIGATVVAALILVALARGTPSHLSGKGATAATPTSVDQVLTPAQPGTAHTEILWDEWGTPHVYARDAEGVFRGFGWAQMHNHGNLLLRLYAQARGNAAEFGGPEYLQSDRAARIMALPERGREWYAAQTPAFRRNIDAFAAGVNEYAATFSERLDDTFKPMLPLTGADVMAHVARDMFIFVSGESGCSDALPAGALSGTGSAGSNAWAIGPSRSAGGNAMLLANPHLNWAGEHIMFEAHLVAPGYDLYGTALAGFPTITIGFNDRLGWTHSNNPIDACDLYELTPAEGGYRFDGQVRPFETRTETLRVRDADGTSHEEAITLRRSVHGPVVEHDGRLLAIRIASVGQTSAAGLVEQWWEMGRAQNLTEFQAALKRNQLPLFNVIYADRDQHVMAFFGGQVPVRPSGYTGSWRGIVSGDTSATLWTAVHPYEELPGVIDPPGGYVQNSNSSPWSYTFPLVPGLDPAAYPSYVAPRSLSERERRGMRMIEETPRMSLETMIRLKYSTRMELADRLLPELIAAARQSGSEQAQQAAAVLAAWDRSAEPESRGPLLFLLWVSALGVTDATLADLFQVAYDPAAPLTTPRGLADPDAAVVALAGAAEQLQALTGRLDTPWGEIARLARGDVDLPASGFIGDPFGVFHVMVPNVERYFAGEPAPVVFGDTFIAAVEFSTPLRARVLMTYGNATQPGSPHIGDQLVLAAQGELRPAWRTREEVEAHLEERTILR